MSCPVGSCSAIASSACCTLPWFGSTSGFRVDEVRFKAKSGSVCHRAVPHGYLGTDGDDLLAKRRQALDQEFQFLVAQLIGFGFKRFAGLNPVDLLVGCDLDRREGFEKQLIDRLIGLVAQGKAVADQACLCFDNNGVFLRFNRYHQCGQAQQQGYGQ